MKLLNKNYYDEAYNLFLNEFISADVRRYEDYINMLENNMYQLHGIVKNEELISAVLTIELADFIFIENLAVKKDYQNQGIGGDMLKQLVDFDKPIVLEVEDDDRLEDRIRFYNRYGLEIYKGDYYYLPQINDDTNENKMFLMSNKLIDNSCYDKLKKDIFKKVYMCYDD